MSNNNIINGHTSWSHRICHNVLDAIGHTPLIRLNHIPQKYGLKCEVLAKCEYFNPSGSLKDRIAVRMIENAEKNGTLKPGYVCIVPTSGNTGISMAWAAGAKGYKCIIVMSEKMSKEKELVIRSLGSEIVRTPISGGSFGENGIYPTVDKLVKKYPNSVVLNQYTDQGNPESHFDTTAQEILDQCGGQLDMLVIGTGTGGTLTGLARRLKRELPKLIVVGVDPIGSELAVPEELNKSESKFFEVEGIGHDFVPAVLDRSLVDFWVKCEDKRSLLMSRELIKEEGLLCGMSSGAVTVATIDAAKNLQQNQRVVTLFGDSIRNYMTKFMADDWMLIRDFITQEKRDIWWWDKELNVLNLNCKYIILEDMTIEEVISYMTRVSINQTAYTVDSQLQGILTKQDILEKMSTSALTPSDKVSTIISKLYKKVYQNITLGALSTLFKNESYLVVFNNKTENKFIGIVTVGDVLNYVNK